MPNKYPFRTICYSTTFSTSGADSARKSAFLSNHAGPTVQPLLKMGLSISAEEFAGALADNLYSDQHVVATVRFYSGNTQEVRVRDLHNCSPGKIEDIINVFCCEVTDGAADSIDDLWSLVDREFRAPNLSARNLYDLTFLEPTDSDTVRNIELVR